MNDSEEKLESERERIGKYRQQLSPEEQHNRRLIDAQRRAAHREQLSPEEQQNQHQHNARRMAAHRQQLSPEQQHNRRQQNAQNMAARREQRSEEEQRNVHQHDAQRRRTSRQRTGTTRMAVDNTARILSGQLEVEIHSLGDQVECKHCKAKLWKHETKRTSICCKKGDVELPITSFFWMP